MEKRAGYTAHITDLFWDFSEHKWIRMPLGEYSENHRHGIIARNPGKVENYELEQSIEKIREHNKELIAQNNDFGKVMIEKNKALIEKNNDLNSLDRELSGVINDLRERIGKLTEDSNNLAIKNENIEKQNKEFFREMKSLTDNSNNLDLKIAGYKCMSFPERLLFLFWPKT